MNIKPTQHEDVNEVLITLLNKAKDILQDKFIGMYLYGSLASGDFDRETSDIDFLIVTKDVLPDTTIAELELMHQDIWKTGLKWTAKLEGSYVHKELIRRHDPHGTPCPTVNEGKFYVDKRGSDWIIQRHVIRESGIILDGPDPKTLIDHVGPNDIRKAVLGILHEWWFPMLNEATWLSDRGVEYHVYAIISMCRALHALEHGVIVSKPKATQWARTNLGQPWEEIITQSLAVNLREETDVLLTPALNFIRYTMERVSKTNNN